MKRLSIAALALSLLGLAIPAAASVGEITHLSGLLTVRKADGSTRVLAVKSRVEEGDVLNTEADTYARLKFVDGGEVVLRPNSQFKVESYKFDAAQPERDNVVVGLLKGGLRAVTGLIGKRSKEKIAYQTPTATIGIRGTHFGALFCQGDCAGIPAPGGAPLPDGLHVDVATGAVSISNAAGTFTFTQGQFAYVPAPNLPPELVPPERGIRVVMPSAIASNRGGGSGIGRGNASECAVE